MDRILVVLARHAGPPLHLDAEHAVSAPDQIRGLAGRASLGARDAMLFSMPESVRTPFTMERMRFPLDVLFLGENGAVLEVFESARPGTMVRPIVWYRRALELLGGTVRREGLDLTKPVGIHRRER